MKRIILAITLFPIMAFAQSGAENIVVLEEPNTLSDVADTMMVTWAYKLTIKGPMSNDDLKFLTEGLFVTNYADKEEYSDYIQWLDLAETTIMPMEASWYPDLRMTPNVPIGTSPGHKWTSYPVPGDQLPTAVLLQPRSLHHIQLPEVKFIEVGLLYYADALEELIFQERLDSIAHKVAMRCFNVKQVYLPSTLMYIGGSFMYGAKPEKMVCAATVPPELYSKAESNLNISWTFSHVDIEHCDLYVPYGSKALYEAAEQWRDFRSITECDTEKMREEMEPGSKQTGVEAHSAVTGTTAVYDLRGVQQKGLRRGLNIVRSGDGKARLMIQTHGK